MHSWKRMVPGLGGGFPLKDCLALQCSLGLWSCCLGACPGQFCPAEASVASSLTSADSGLSSEVLASVPLVSFERLEQVFKLVQSWTSEMGQPSRCSCTPFSSASFLGDPPCTTRDAGQATEASVLGFGRGDAVCACCGRGPTAAGAQVADIGHIDGCARQ